jgi:arginine/lysine/histidine transporter system substrate-binding protein
VKKRVFKSVSAIVLLVVMVFSLAGCGTAKTTAKAGLAGYKAKGTIVVGMSADTPPYEFHATINGKDTIVGSDVKLLDQISKDLGVKYKIQDMNFDGLLVALQSGKIDMILSAMSPTKEREKNADFSDVYYKSTNVFVVRKDELNNFKTAKDFDHASIAVINSSTQQQVVQSQFPDAKLKQLEQTTDLAMNLASKKVDAILVDIPTSELLEKGYPSIVSTKFNYSDNTAGAAIAMPKNTDPEVMKTINNTINRVKPEYNNWIKEEVKFVK